MTHMYINAASHYLPETRIPNEYYTRLLGVSDEWIFRRSGIRKRSKAGPEENTNTLSIEAVKPALENLPYPVGEIDLIVGATYTPYDTVGTLAHAVQAHYDISSARAVTISSACSSFINAMEIVEGYIAAGKSKKALVIAAEHNSAYSDDEDEQSGHLWGDGAGAVFVSEERLSARDMEVVDVSTTSLAHMGKGIEGVYLRPKNGGLKMPFGKEIFMYASRFMIAEVENILKRNHLTLDDMAYLIPHQANSRIISSIASSLGLLNGRMIVNMENTGNTGCASTSIAFSQNWEKFKKNELVVLTVFGGGYSSGAMLLRR